MKPALSQLKSLRLVWDLLFMVAVPTVVFALVGRALDSRWHTSPIFTLMGLFLALIVTSIIMYRKAKTIALDLI